MNLDDLRQSVSSMKDEDLTDLLRNIRSTRRTPVNPPKKTKEKKAVSPSVPDLNVATLIAGLSKDQIAAMLNKLNEEKK